MTMPDFGRLVDSFKSAMLPLQTAMNQHKRRLVILVVALALVLVLALGFGLVGLAISRGSGATVADPDLAQGYSLKGAKVLRDLYMPGPAVGETPFPLAFEPDPGYTDDDALMFNNDMSRIDISDLAARRKAELEAIYDALD